MRNKEMLSDKKKLLDFVNNAVLKCDLDNYTLNKKIPNISKTEFLVDIIKEQNIKIKTIMLVLITYIYSNDYDTNLDNLIKKIDERL